MKNLLILLGIFGTINCFAGQQIDTGRFLLVGLAIFCIYFFAIILWLILNIFIIKIFNIFGLLFVILFNSFLGLFLYYYGI